MNNIYEIMFCCYLVIGFFMSFFIWNKYYKNDYDILKAENNVDKPMVSIFMLFLILLWPIELIRRKIWN